MRKLLASVGILDSLALLVIAVAVAGTTTDPRNFAKLKVGPLYALECALLLLGILILASGWRPNFKQCARDLWPAAAFAGWGFILLAVDFMSGLHAMPLTRVLQHSIIFVYPICWMSIGYWLEKKQPTARVLLIYFILLLNCRPNFSGVNTSNLSLGPLLAVVFLLQLHRVRDRNTWIIALFLGFFALLPFWSMWLYSMQRTSLLDLVMMMILIPILATRRGMPGPRPFKTSAIAFAILVGGMAVYPFALDLAGFHFKWSLKSNFMSSMQHGEDVPSEPGERPFQFRTRSAMWHYAVSDWKARPLIGIGFIPEVPSWILPDIPNVGGFETPTSPPLSGPHNSFLSVWVRMGPLGLALILTLLFGIFRAASALTTAGPLSLPDLLMISILVSGVIYALFNVGFEAPHYSLILWLVGGALVARRGVRSETRLGLVKKSI